MFTIKDTEHTTGQPSWLVLEDINRRAEYAYNTHQELFDSVEHQSRVAQARAITENYITGCVAVYETARQKTSRRAAHTELKFNKCILNRANSREDFLAKIEELGNIDVVYKPATNSYSLHIF